MNRKRTIRRLGVVTALLGLLLLATAAPVTPAAPQAGSLSITTQAQYWAEHPGCVAVDIDLGGDLVDVGGYETKLTFDTTHLGYTGGNITLSDFLTDGATRSTSGDDGTPLLEATDTDNVMFGDYSWGTDAGADGAGTLATIGLDGVACGTGSLSLSETQVVDYQGNLLDMGTDPSTNVTIRHRYDTNGDGLPFITGQDVTQVVINLGPGGANCGAGYQYDTNLDGLPFITGQDVTQVVINLGPASCP